MRALKILSAVIASLYLAACSHAPVRSNPVGRLVMAFEDNERGSWVNAQKRPLLTVVWYPAKPGTSEQRWNVGIFRAGWNAYEADIQTTSAKMPLVVLSHGTGSGSALVSWLAEALAAKGYLVASVNHHGNTAAEDRYLPQGFVLWWERARDLSAVIDRLLADPRFGSRIDTTRIGAAGFSLGGYTVLATAGARLNRAQWERYCADKPRDPNCTLPPESPFSMAEIKRLVEEEPSFKKAVAQAELSYRDERIRAVYVIAPALGPALEEKSLGSIRIPVRIVVGELDDQTPPDTNARPVAARIPGAELELLPRVSHYTFLAPCGIRGRLVARLICIDADGIDRAEVHQRVGADAVAYFNRALNVDQR